ncbi:BZ3500_MvSof-1268-A1-R1_Chr5-2g07921 [Microbotryum saponariae]|uniref:BZ3500_MvSof-1268-A1-R1_Chr5-2g07921 protein n=1 Tax=Microbotryum saponariae TaxID=289078 RepID=A0A2X0LKM3_9BASI|nr:BZ3500_MvSof-1268-A1-R1_Chr5-2g07921 [Microbotryum saponariae]SDA05790.1 BZ3501_MvSof-1269-A2-R1_Chr5-2g07743 [Microbotryum saponariae]
MAATTEDIVYALHDFEAENEDELSFAMGSKIVILERDDQYGDGWYQGRNEAGEVGLFPQSYTSISPPSPEEDDDDVSLAETGRHSSVPVVAANMNEVQQALASLQVQRAANLEPAVAQSGDSSSEDELDEGKSIAERGNVGPNGSHPEVGVNHRAALAATAALNAERAAREEREREEQRRKDDEAAYERSRQEGLVEGLQLSDESDDEAGLPLPLTVPLHPTTLPAASTKFDAPSGSTVTPAVVVSNGDIPHEPVTPNGSVDAAAFVSSDNPVSRDLESSSTYAESTYSEASVAEEPVDDAVPAATGIDNGLDSINIDPSHAPILATSAVSFSSPPTTASAAAVSQPALESAAPMPQASSASDHVPLLAGAGLATGAVAVGVAAHHAFASNEHLSKAVEATSSAAARAVTPDSVLPPSITSTPVALPLALPVAAVVSPGPNSGRILSPSQSSLSISTRAGSGSVTDATTNGTSHAAGTLPYDPRVWSVDEVCEWATSKGFDALTLAKFREHEISGDVLVEMDVAMLKEIDLVAFGRRVHIYNAIKELKGRFAPRGNALSPTGSGYEPDTPSTMGYATPATYHPTTFGSSGQRAMGFEMHGLGLDGSSDQHRRPMSFRTSSDGPSRSASQTHLNDLQSSQNSSMHSSGMVGADLGAAQHHALIHRRSYTGDTGRESLGADAAIPEEVEESPVPGNKTSTNATPVLGAVGASSVRAAKSQIQPKSARRVSDSEISLPPSPTHSTSTKGTRKDSGDRTFFGAIARARKPPPRVSNSDSVASGLSSDGATSTTTRPGSSRAKSALTQARRTTRLFGSFGTQSAEGGRSSNERVGTLDVSKASTRNKRMSGISATRDAPSSMSPKAVDAVGSEMMRKELEPVAPGANLMEKIGTPDYSGWMQKKGEKYNTWKQRFFVLKGIHLYYLKSESEQRVKGVINLKGYRVITDPNIHPGEYAFKIVHDRERSHLFSAREQYTVRNWMREIIKATIARNYEDPVVSSCDIDTMPLTIAQTMYPPPRPPSPTERARVQKERYGDANPNTLTPADAQKLMEFSAGSTLMPDRGTGSTGRRTSTAPDAGRRASLSNLAPGTGPGALPAIPTQSASVAKSPSNASRNLPAPSIAPANPSEAEKAALLAWVNANLPSSTPLATDLGASLSSGQTLVRLVESLSGKPSNISDADFAKHKPAPSGSTMDVDYFDTVFNVFDYLSPIVSTDEISMSDLLSGNDARLSLLVTRIKTVFDP